MFWNRFGKVAHQAREISAVFSLTSRVPSGAHPTDRLNLVMSYHKNLFDKNTVDDYVVNLRSDTFSLPTANMKQAMVTAQLGDDVYGEDPTVNRLQDECAALLGKEAALLVVSGTMGNLTSVLSHCHDRFQEVLLGDRSHMHLFEVGGIASIAGIQPRVLANQLDGTLDLAELKNKIRPRTDPHQPWTQLICLESTHNRCGGVVLSLDYIRRVREIADANDLKLHLDGARLMNAATALNVAPLVIAQYFDSVSMCFSKGLSCPVGAIIAGTKDFIRRALWARKALGGGLRQAGVIAAPMLVALKEIVPDLHQDHVRARRIAEAIANLGNKTVIKPKMETVQSNVVLLHTTHGGVNTEEVCKRLAQVTDKEAVDLGERISVLVLPTSHTSIRYVTYNGIQDVTVEKAIKKIEYVMREMSSN